MRSLTVAQAQAVVSVGDFVKTEVASMALQSLEDGDGQGHSSRVSIEMVEVIGPSDGLVSDLDNSEGLIVPSNFVVDFFFEVVDPDGVGCRDGLFFGASNNEFWNDHCYQQNLNTANQCYHAYIYPAWRIITEICCNPSKYIQVTKTLLGLEMIMVFIWLGSLLQPQHQQTIKDCEDYPGNRCILLQNYHFKYYMEKYKGMLGLTEERMERFIMDEKVDLLRLFYLHDKGGIYSDMDNKINYTCLEKFIEKKNLTQFFSQEQYDETYPSNNFIYSPTPHHPNIEFVLNKVKEFENFTDFNFVGTAMFRHIMENLTYVNIRQCVEHGYQISWKWFEGANAKNLISPSQAVEFAQCRRDNIRFQEELQELNSTKAALSEQFQNYKTKNEIMAENRQQENESLTNLLYISLGFLVSILIITLILAVKSKRTNRTEHHHSAINMAEAEEASLSK